VGGSSSCLLSPQMLASETAIKTEWYKPNQKVKGPFIPVDSNSHSIVVRECVGMRRWPNISIPDAPCPRPHSPPKCHKGIYYLWLCILTKQKQKSNCYFCLFAICYLCLHVAFRRRQCQQFIFSHFPALFFPCFCGLFISERNKSRTCLWDK